MSPSQESLKKSTPPVAKNPDVGIFGDYFKGRTTDFAEQTGSGSYIRCGRPITDEDISDHLSGKNTYAIYPINPRDNTCFLIVIDIDNKDITFVEKIVDAALKAGLKSYQILIEFSGCKGYHVLLRFTKPIPAKKARELGRIITALSEVELDIEVFPKQNTVTEDGFGCLVKLPLGVHKKSNQRSHFLDNTFQPVSDWQTHLNSIQKIEPEEVDVIIEEFNYLISDTNKQTNSACPSGSAKTLPCFVKIAESGVSAGERNEIAFQFAKQLKRQGLPKDMTDAALIEWNAKNSPPLSEEELLSIVKSVYSRAYSGYGCDKEVMQKYCSAECPIKRKAALEAKKDNGEGNENGTKDPTLERKIIDTPQPGNAGAASSNIIVVRKQEFPPISVKELSDVLGQTIKKDVENKVIVFLCEISAYTDSAQFNTSFNAPSSTGKSYIPIEVSTLFPQEDVKIIGYCSPTAFFHDFSQYDKETKTYLADLSRQVIIFLDQPHTLLLQHLRPILSHDRKEVVIKITDKTKAVGLRTKTIIIRGYPSVIFCTAGLKTDEQESTRFFLLSPEINQEKIRAAICEKLAKESDAEAYRLTLRNSPERAELKERIIAIRQEHIEQINIGSPELIKEYFLTKHKMLKPRHARDIGRLISLVKSLALLNLWDRKRCGNVIVANEEDVKEAIALWDTIYLSQDLNLPPYLHNLYLDIIRPIYYEDNKEKRGVERRAIIRKHYDVYHRPLSDWQLRREVLPAMEMAGLILQESDSYDKRRMLVYPADAKI